MTFRNRHLQYSLGQLKYGIEYATESWSWYCSRAGARRQQEPLVGLFDDVLFQSSARIESAFERWVEGLRYLFHARALFMPMILSWYGLFSLYDKPTAFFLACQYDLREVVEKMLDDGFDINQPTSQGLTGLAFACYGEKHDLISYLITRGARITFDYDDDSLLSPLVVAIAFAYGGRVDMLNFLLSLPEVKVTQSILEWSLESRNIIVSGEVKLSTGFWSSTNVERTLKILLPLVSSIEYTREIRRNMVRNGPKMTALLLERDPGCLSPVIHWRIYFSGLMRQATSSRFYSTCFISAEKSLIINA